MDRAVERFVKEHGRPCSGAALENLPCFPVEVERKREPDASVAQGLQDFVTEELRSGRRGPTGPPGLSFDPVCVAKSAVKALKGKNDVYYLYRLTGPGGDRMALYDRPLAPEAYAAVPGVSYEFLGEFDGECDAVAAYRRAVRTGKARR